ncbi:MAG TPA: metal-dependent hydrolase [Candidatus Acidoferrales bacterium]|nr:metal-dependent hydrolase [Candidatus Acidoferrales bacterium]
MDTITHGIAGALIGKGIFAERWGTPALFAATLGSVFPDCDVAGEIISRDPMSLLKYHRGITHSFVAMPVFAAGLGALTWWLARRRGIRTSPGMLMVAAGVGLASHILLDGLTSFGTRMWEPISYARVSWDWLFIIDPMLTALVLVPQLGAWANRDRARAPWRALAMWALCTVLAVLTWGAEWAAGAGISFAMVPVAAIVFSGVFFLPLVAWEWFAWSRRDWCLAGLVLTVLYVGWCGVAHQRALGAVRQFARNQPLPVEDLAAVPLPPSPWAWSGLVRTPQGIYGAQFFLGEADAPDFHFLHNAPSNTYIEEAFRLRRVETYLGFARFPLVRFHRLGDMNIVEFSDIRFVEYARRRNQHPFTFQVVFSADGRVLREGWLMR